MAQERTWWKEAVVYQIYPRSFYDADGDGIGDLQGIIEKLDYVADLGVDVIWLNPVYDSPQRDNGYDISDYRSIDETFGDMDTWRRLLDEIHTRDMRLVMDLVVNHTSVDHEWFQRSRRGDPEYEDFYHWRDTDDGRPPNNWDSFFGGSAWEHDAVRDEQYLHLYDTSQPDLNWANEDVREAVYEIVDWWFQQGIDGFRMDVINLLSKAAGLPDGDPDSEWVGSEHFVDGPELLDYLVELEERVLSNYDGLTVGEMPQLTVEQARTYAGADGPLDLAFHFQHTKLDYGDDGRWSVGEWDLTELKAITDRWQTELADDGWNALYWENHDQPRVVSRYGDPDEYRRESATMLGTFVLTLRGTPFVYQGQELGMTNAPFPTIEDLRDVDAINHARELMAERDCEYDAVRSIVEYRTRDNARTPMQWSDDDHAGFTDGEPWIDANPNYSTVNVERERADPDSVLSYYRELIDLRSSTPTLIYGEFRDLLPDDRQVYAYERRHEDDCVVVVLNTSGSAASVELPVGVPEACLLSNYDESPTDLSGATLRPYEAAVYRV
ncbi:alpha-glucosidase [Halomicrobium sp. IBSBa]|uniref:glycoside hydrolase family 13 protein n=1 Tax=Halomicrobium sp. IBSBa TaxID=2778916 RepID=UPI001ABF63CC|nr:alpha-glucosidase [Halomicrobium sp. IBSBa]MBO4248265.1 alpha-glucosidase [Halomicrobium sp. IBSBa]